MRLSRAELDSLREQIRRATDLRELAVEHGLERPRPGALWLCPFHTEGTGSFKIWCDHFHCYGACGEHGDCFDFLEKLYGWSFREALEYLAGRLGLSLPWTPTTSLPRRRTQLSPLSGRTTTPEPEPPTIDPERRAEILTSFCEAASIRGSATPKSHPGLGYLANRGIGPVTARAYRLGYVTDYPKADDWLAARYDRDELTAAGIYSPKGHLRCYRHRLLLPYWSGDRVVGLQCRDCDGGQPKELTLGPVGAPFNCNVLLGEPGEVHVTEGAIDCLSLLELGLPAVAVPGVYGFRPQWTALFRGWQVVLAFDADDAGRAATGRVAAMFAAKGQTVQTLTLPPDCKDVNELLLRKAA